VWEEGQKDLGVERKKKKNGGGGSKKKEIMNVDNQCIHVKEGKVYLLRVSAGEKEGKGTGVLLK